jgi:hypothetical protein
MGFQIGFPALRNYPTPPATGYDADAQAMFDKRAAEGDEPTAPYKQAISDLVTDLKAVSGLWDDIIQLVVLAGATTVNGARQSIKGNDLTNVNFVDADIFPKTGSQGNGSNKHWRTGYSGTVAGTGQNDFHTYGYFTDSGAGTEILMGNGGSVNGTWNIRADGSSRCRSNTSNNGSAPGPGGWGLNRSVAGSFERMRASSVETLTRASQTPATLEYSFMAAAAGVAPTSGRGLIYAMGPAIATLADYNTPVDDFITAINAI